MIASKDNYNLVENKLLVNQTQVWCSSTYDGNILLEIFLILKIYQNIFF